MDNLECQDCGRTIQTSPRGELQGVACPDCGGQRLFRMQPSPVQSDGTIRNMVDPDTGKDAGGNPSQEGILGPSSGHDILAAFGDEVRTCENCGWNARVHPGERDCPKCHWPFEPDEGNGNPAELRPEIAGAPLTEGTIMGTEHTDPYDTGSHGRDEYAHSHVIAGLMEDFEEQDQPNVRHEREVREMEDARAHERNRVWQEQERLKEQVSELPCPYCGKRDTHPTPDFTGLYCESCGRVMNIPENYQQQQLPGEVHHPDPWMDNEPGSLTVPTGPTHTWGKEADVTDFYNGLSKSRPLAPPKPEGPVPLWEPPRAPQVSKCRNCKKPINTQTGECPFCGQLNFVARVAVQLVTDESGNIVQRKWIDPVSGESREEPYYGENLKWSPGMHGRGLVIGGQPHTWNALDPRLVDKGLEHAKLGPLHREYVTQRGINPMSVDFNSGIEIRPNGEIEAKHDADTSPFIEADPRLKEIEGNFFTFNAGMPQPNENSKRELYDSWMHVADVMFDKGPIQNSLPTPPLFSQSRRDSHPSHHTPSHARLPRRAHQWHPSQDPQQRDRRRPRYGWPGVQQARHRRGTSS